MDDDTREWFELLDWMCREAGVPDPPTCLPIAVKGWFETTTSQEREAADDALMHWLMIWEWPEIPPRVQGIVHLRLAFAVYGLIQGMAAGRPVLRGEAQKRGTIHGLVFRNWERMGNQWLDYYAVEWPSVRAMSQAGGN